MQLKYGTYSFTKDVVSYDRSLVIQRSQTGTPSIAREKWIIRGRIRGTSTADITAKANALYAAMLDGSDLVFFDNSGAATSDKLTHANQLNGCQVDGLRWLPNGGDSRESGAEFVNMRSYEIIINGQRIAGNNGDVMSWQESVTQFGTGGPKFIMVPSITGVPLAMQTQAITPITIIQQGRAIGLNSYPNFAAPLFPAIEHLEMRVRTQETPRAWGLTNSKNLEYPCSWKYVYEGLVNAVSPNSYH